MPCRSPWRTADERRRDGAPRTATRDRRRGRRGRKESCEVEAWADRSHDRREYWAQPACNFGGNALPCFHANGAVARLLRACFFRLTRPFARFVLALTLA